MSTQRASLPIYGLQHQNDSRLFKGRLAGERFYSLSMQGEQVPFRRIKLSPTPEAFGGQKQPSIYLNDVTGPFGEETYDILPKKRSRPEPGSPTQLAAARAGIVTAEMAYVAVRENLCRDLVKQEVAQLKNDKLMPTSVLLPHPKIGAKSSISYVNHCSVAQTRSWISLPENPSRRREK